MCTGQRGFYVCPCIKPQCPKKGIVPHRLVTQGHVCKIEVDTIAWEICEWWIANGPPEQVLNRYLKPSCQYFVWHTLIIRAELCPECQITCVEILEESGSGDTKTTGESEAKGSKK